MFVPSYMCCQVFEGNFTAANLEEVFLSVLILNKLLAFQDCIGPLNATISYLMPVLNTYPPIQDKRTRTQHPQACPSNVGIRSSSILYNRVFAIWIKAKIVQYKKIRRGSTDTVGIQILTEYRIRQLI